MWELTVRLYSISSTSSNICLCCFYTLPMIEEQNKAARLNMRRGDVGAKSFCFILHLLCGRQWPKHIHILTYWILTGFNHSWAGKCLTNFFSENKGESYDF